MEERISDLGRFIEQASGVLAKYEKMLGMATTDAEREMCRVGIRHHEEFVRWATTEAAALSSAARA